MFFPTLESCCSMSIDATRKPAAVALAGIISLVAVGCSAPTTQSGSAADFPESQFPKSTFGNLSGSVVWHDGSGGATTTAREETVFKDFTTLTGVTTQADFNSDTTKFFATMQSGAPVPWSLVEFPTKGDFLKAKEAGYLEPLDTAVVPTGQLEEGTYDEFGVDVLRYGITFTYNTDKWPDSGEHPTKMEDLYDTQKFPGKRCMYKYPQFGATLESALLADGVKREELYPLDTDRALAKLDTIKNDIVWWTNGDEAVRFLSSGECDMGVTWSGRAFSAVTKDNAPLAISWENSLFTDAVYAIPKGAPDKAAAQALMAMWILDKKGQIELVKKIPYPTAITGLNPVDYGQEVAPWLPSGENAAKAIPEDSAYYAKNIGNLTEIFNQWVSN
jgi:putative spermidine/putrescine transport system substrate-binding protein